VNVLLTGGAGFVGIAIAEKLLQEGCNVVCYDLNPLPRAAEASFEALSGSIFHLHGNVLDQTLLEDTILSHDINVVIHTAAITPDIRRETHEGRSIVDVNCGGTTTVLNAACKTGTDKFIFASTGAVYGKGQWQQPLLHEDLSLPNPESFYEITKFAAERIVLRYRELTNLNVVILRLGDVFGAWEYRSGVRDILSAPFQVTQLALQGDKAWLPRPGFKNWVYSRDIGAACFAILTALKLQHNIYHLSCDYRWSIEQWCELLAEKYPDFSFAITADPDSANVIFRPDHSPMSIDRLLQDTNYHPGFDLGHAFNDYTRWIKGYSDFMK